MNRKFDGIVPAVLTAAMAFGLVACDQNGESNTVGAVSAEDKTTAKEDSSAKSNTEAAPASTAMTAENASAAAAEKPAIDRSGLSAPLADASRSTKPSVADRAGSLLSNTTGKVSTPQAPSGEVYVTAAPEKLELGDIPTGDKAAGVITLTNTDTVKHQVTDCKTSCGCTTANCQKGKWLEPGESMEVEIVLDAGDQGDKTINKTVTFMVTDQDPLIVPVSGNAVAYVAVEPIMLNRDNEESATSPLTLTAKDDMPFVVKSVFPPVIDGITDEPKVVHELAMNWSQWDERGGRDRRLTVQTDHPKAGRISVNLRAKPKVASIGPDGNPLPQPKRISSTPALAFDARSLLAEGNTAKMLELINDGKVVNERGEDISGQEVFLKSAFFGNTKIMQAMLDAGTNIEQVDQRGWTALMHAVTSMNADAIKLLVESGAKLETIDQLGNTALCWAAIKGDAAGMKYLVDAGADVNVVGKLTGYTPLIWAAGFGDAEKVQVLIAAGAELESVDTLESSTPLMYAVRTGKNDNVSALVEAGANIHAVDNKGRTPLIIAATQKGANPETVRILLDAGADPAATDSFGNSALDLARNRTDEDGKQIAAILEQRMGTASKN